MLTVEELIALLQKEDPKKEVRILDSNRNGQFEEEYSVVGTQPGNFTFNLKKGYKIF